LKEIEKRLEDEDDVSSYWIALKEREDDRN
jgi:hypothetical protein